MSRPIYSAAAYAVLGGLIAVAALLIGVDRTDLVLDAYLVFLAALTALTAARMAGMAFARPRGVVPSVLARQRRRNPRPEALAVTENVVALGLADNFDLHFQLRPILREVATEGVAARTGLDLDGSSPRVPPLFSEPTWELVRPDRPRPEGDHRKGIVPSDLDAVVTDLERMLA
jgi:hypothetical protein